MRNRWTCTALAGVAAACLLLSLPAPAQEDPLADPTRPGDERARDAGTRPLEIYRWMDVRMGMTVVDFIPSAGYNSHLLGRLVGPEGRVIAAFTTERGAAALGERFTGAGLDNVQVALNLAEIPDASIDRHVTVRNLHDLFIPEVAAQYELDPDVMIGELHRTLKADGFLCVVDARTPKEGADAATHRINEDMVVRELEARGFELVERSDLLAKPDDDFEAGGFPTRWNVDRMLLKFRKVAGR